MTGLETILNQITGDAQREADELLSDARKKSEEILEEAKQEAARQSQEVLRQSEKKAQEIRDRASSAAQLKVRDEMLVFKQELIHQAIDEVRLSLENAPASEYFSTVLSLVSRFAQTGKGEMFFNAKDLERLPQDFEEKLAQAVPGKEIVLSKIPRDVESGFLLVYGGVDINCTFRAIFEDAYDQLRDVVGQIMFAQA